jgi:hypothetical protein
MSAIDTLKAAPVRTLMDELALRTTPLLDERGRTVEPATHVLITMADAVFILGLLNQIQRLQMEQNDAEV